MLQPQRLQSLFANRSEPTQDGTQLPAPRGHRHLRPHPETRPLRQLGQAAQGHPARHPPRAVLGRRGRAADGHGVAAAEHGRRRAQEDVCAGGSGDTEGDCLCQGCEDSLREASTLQREEGYTRPGRTCRETACWETGKATPKSRDIALYDMCTAFARRLLVIKTNGGPRVPQSRAQSDSVTMSRQLVTFHLTQGCRDQKKRKRKRSESIRRAKHSMYKKDVTTIYQVEQRISIGLV